MTSLRRKNNTDSSSPNLSPKKPKNDFSSYTSICNIYKTARLIIPTEFSNVIESNIEPLAKNYNCQIFLPISSTEERNLFLVSNLDRDDKNQNHFNNNIDLVLPENDNSAMLSLAQLIQKIATLLAPGIKSKYNKIMNHKGSDSIEIRLLFNNKTAGRIIGNSGSNIRKMKNTHKNNINIYRENPPKSTDRVCQIYGPPENCFYCPRITQNPEDH